MAKSRYVNTEFWDDAYIATLHRDLRYLWLYLLTNPLTNIAGAYQIKLKRIALDTDLTLEEIQAGLDKFEQDGKVIYKDGWMLIVNFIKHQTTSKPVLKGMSTILSKCPQWIIDKVSIRYQQINITPEIFNLNLNLNSNLNPNLNSEAEAQEDEQEQESVLPCLTDSTQPRNHPISNFSPADAEIAETMAWLCERKNLVRLNDEKDWLNVFIRCESEKIDFKTFYDWLDRKRDKSRTSTVTVKMMLSDSWIASFKAETEKPTQPPKQTDSERVRAEAKYFTSVEFLDQIKAGLPQKSEAVN